MSNELQVAQPSFLRKLLESQVEPTELVYNRQHAKNNFHPPDDPLRNPWPNAGWAPLRGKCRRA
jgi:hypothetical protein